MNGCVNRLYQNSQRVAQVTRYCASSQVNVARGYHVYTAQNLNAKSQDTPKRYQTLNEGKTGLYPRLDTTQPGISCSDFVQRYYDWTGTEAQVESDICSVNGAVNFPSDSKES